jgi:hypothetical protein
MARKPLPFADRPTWQRVKEMQEAAFQLRFCVENALSMRKHWEKPAVQDAIERQLRDAVATLCEAMGTARPEEGNP